MAKPAPYNYQSILRSCEERKLFTCVRARIGINKLYPFGNLRLCVIRLCGELAVFSEDFMNGRFQFNQHPG